MAQQQYIVLEYVMANLNKACLRCAESNTTTDNFSICVKCEDEVKNSYDHKLDKSLTMVKCKECREEVLVSIKNLENGSPVICKECFDSRCWG